MKKENTVVGSAAEVRAALDEIGSGTAGLQGERAACQALADWTGAEQGRDKVAREYRRALARMRTARGWRGGSQAFRDGALRFVERREAGALSPAEAAHVARGLYDALGAPAKVFLTDTARQGEEERESKWKAEGVWP